MKINTFALALLPALLLSAGMPASAHESVDDSPLSKTIAGDLPSTYVQKLASRRPPALIGTADVAKKNALAFINWAATSTKEQDNLVRESMAAAGKNPDIIIAMCDSAFATQTTDHSKTLVTLSLIGEAKSAVGIDCLEKFVSQPLPEQGTLVDGEILEQTNLAMLQAKAIDGLAYLHDPRADDIVINTLAKSPSRIVRAEAISAYLWNHNYDLDAQKMLRSVVRPDELIFLERIVKQADETKDSFNRKLAIYLKKHPELAPPAPEKALPKTVEPIAQPPRF